jgi:hypothetical protein
MPAQEKPPAKPEDHYFQGMYIIPPESSFSLFFLSPGNWQVYARVAFGWWEEKAE